MTTLDDEVVCFSFSHNHCRGFEDCHHNVQVGFTSVHFSLDHWSLKNNAILRIQVRCNGVYVCH